MTIVPGMRTGEVVMIAVDLHRQHQAGAQAGKATEQHTAQQQGTERVQAIAMQQHLVEALTVTMTAAATIPATAAAVVRNRIACLSTGSAATCFCRGLLSTGRHSSRYIALWAGSNVYEVHTV